MEYLGIYPKILGSNLWNENSYLKSLLILRATLEVSKTLGEKWSVTSIFQLSRNGTQYMTKKCKFIVSGHDILELTNGFVKNYIQNFWTRYHLMMSMQMVGKKSCTGKAEKAVAKLTHSSWRKTYWYPWRPWRSEIGKSSETMVPTWWVSDKTLILRLPSLSLMN